MRQKKDFKGGVALLITLLFIIVISVAIGVSLKQLKNLSSDIGAEKFLYQTSVIVDDVLKLLKKTPQLQDINSSEDLRAFLDFSPIPFESNGVKVLIELSSARAKYNINSILDQNETIENTRIALLKEYFNKYMINVDFVDILLDMVGGIKEDYSYNSEIFNDNPELFRNYIASKKHFSEAKRFYVEKYQDDTLKNINFDELFYFKKDINSSYSLDLNFATAQVWEMMLGCDSVRAEELSSHIDEYNSYEDIDLSDDELNIVKNIFKTSFFEPFIYAEITIIQNANIAVIKFEYDVKNKKGSNFVYEI